MIRTPWPMRRAMRRTTVTATVLGVIGLTTAAVVTSAPTPVETRAEGSRSVLCVDLSSPDYVDETCLFDDDRSRADIWPEPSLDIEIRTHEPSTWE